MNHQTTTAQLTSTCADGSADTIIRDLTVMPEVTSSPMSRRLRLRAGSLRRDANVRLAPLAAALRRRAAELELHAFLLDNRLQPIPVKSR